MVLPKLYALSGEAHHTLRSRPKKEHSVSLGFFFQRDLLLKLYLKACSRCLFRGPLLRMKLHSVTSGFSLGFMWYWTEVNAALKTKPTSAVWLAHSVC